MVSNSEFIHISAPSGSGKSTLVHILYGIRKDYSGMYFINDNQISFHHTPMSRLRAESFSIVFQDMKLFPELTGIENLLIKNQLKNTCTTEEIETYLSRLKVAHLRDKKAATMSLGEQQRIAIIKSLLQPFSWIFLDEPFSHLDTENIQKAAELIQEVCKKNNAGMLLATLGEKYGFTFNRYLQL